MTAPPLHYFNTAAIGMPSPRVCEAVSAFARLNRSLGPASLRARSLIAEGIESDLLRSDEREVLAGWRGIPSAARTLCQVAGASDSAASVVFTSGTSAALQLALMSLPKRNGDLVCTDMEHESEYQAIRSIWPEPPRIVSIREAILDGAADADVASRVASEVTDRSTLLISHVTASEGAVLPLEKICGLVRSATSDALILVDGAHGPGNIVASIGNLDFDAYLGSGHKWLRGPLTSGFILLTDRGLASLGDHIHASLPTAYGWQEATWRTKTSTRPNCGAVGTANVTPLVGLAVAMQELLDYGIREQHAAAQRSCRQFEDAVTADGVWTSLSASFRVQRGVTCTLALSRRPQGASDAELRGWAQRLELAHNVVCEPAYPAGLRFSFSGHELADDIPAAVAALSEVIV